MKNKSGFTLIELLVVVAIIAVISVSTFSIYTNSQKKARDGRRKADLEIIRGALEVYKADNKAYPDVKDILVDTGYLKALPTDPTIVNGYRYKPSDNRLEYDLGTCLEIEDAKISCTNTGFYQCPDLFNKYCITNP